MMHQVEGVVQVAFGLHRGLVSLGVVLRQYLLHVRIEGVKHGVLTAHTLGTLVAGLVYLPHVSYNVRFRMKAVVYLKIYS